MKQKWSKVEEDTQFNKDSQRQQWSYSVMDRKAKWTINKEMVDLNNTINQLNLIDIYKTFHPTTAVYKLVFKAHKTFTNMEVP